MTKHTRTLTRWGLVMAGGKGPVLAGDEDGFSRTSTPLVAFDPEAGTALTASGRPYRLVGGPDPVNALRCFHSLWNAGGAKVEVITPEEAVLRAKANTPFDFSPEERERLARLKMDRMADEIRMQMTVQGLGRTEAAAALGMDEDKLEAILASDVSRATPDESDDAFSALFRLGSNRPA